MAVAEQPTIGEKREVACGACVVTNAIGPAMDQTILRHDKLYIALQSRDQRNDKERERRREGETEEQREVVTEGQRTREREGQIEEGQRNGGTEGQRGGGTEGRRDRERNQEIDYRWKSCGGMGRGTKRWRDGWLERKLWRTEGRSDRGTQEIIEGQADGGAGGRMDIERKGEKNG